MDSLSLPNSPPAAATEERRAYLRYRIGTQVRVIDRLTGRQLGCALDISAGGLSLATEGPIAPGLNYSLMLETRVRGEPRPMLALEARCVWRRQDESLGRECAGFSFARLSPAQGAAISSLVEEVAP
jgi:c-di-GMP-binding flagellar brake protein YcgR